MGDDIVQWSRIYCCDYDYLKSVVYFPIMKSDDYRMKMLGGVLTSEIIINRIWLRIWNQSWILLNIVKFLFILWERKSVWRLVGITVIIAKFITISFRFVTVKLSEFLNVVSIVSLVCEMCLKDNISQETLVNLESERNINNVRRDIKFH